MASEARPTLRTMEPRLRRSVLALLTSVFCTSTAMAALAISLGKQVFDITGRELDLGLLGLAEFAPALLLVFVTGPVADRFDRRLIARLAISVEAVFALVLAWYAGTDPTSVGPIFLGVIGYGVARAFAMPATRSLPADTMPPAGLPWLVARQSIMWQSASIVGPVIAGFLYVAGVQYPFFMAVGLLVLSTISLSFVHVDARDAEVAQRTAAAVRVDDDTASPGEVAVAKPARPRLHEALEGIRFVRGDPILLGVISLDLFAVLFGGAIALLPAIAEERLGVGAVGLGWLRAAVGIGAAAVTVVLAMRPVTRRVGPRMLLAVAVFGIATIAFGITTNFVVAWVALAVAAGADAVSVFIRATLVPLVTPADKRGRVLAVEMVFIGASNELGAFESGVVGQALGPAASVVIGGVATVAIASTWGSLFPDLRRVDRFPQSIN